MMQDTQDRGYSRSLIIWEREIGVHFSNQSLLRRALTHRSYLNEHPEALEDNERLEFLGDAVLDFIVGAWLYHRFPEMEEGDLTRMRAALVRTEQLAEFAREIDLDEMILLGRGEEVNGGRERDPLLCAAFEALVGALYLDQGLSLVQDFTAPFLPPAVDVILSEGRVQDPKSILQEWTQAQGLEIPRYRVLSERGPDHAKVFGIEVLIGDEVFGVGTGSSKREAAREAASRAIERLNISM
jgi:ribonuclease-3